MSLLQSLKNAFRKVQKEELLVVGGAIIGANALVKNDIESFQKDEKYPFCRFMAMSVIGGVGGSLFGYCSPLIAASMIVATPVYVYTKIINN